MLGNIKAVSEVYEKDSHRSITVRSVATSREPSERVSISVIAADGVTCILNEVDAQELIEAIKRCSA